MVRFVKIVGKVELYEPVDVFTDHKVPAGNPFSMKITIYSCVNVIVLVILELFTLIIPAAGVAIYPVILLTLKL